MYDAALYRNVKQIEAVYNLVSTVRKEQLRSRSIIFASDNVYLGIYRQNVHTAFLIRVRNIKLLLLISQPNHMLCGPNTYAKTYGKRNLLQIYAQFFCPDLCVRYMQNAYKTYPTSDVYWNKDPSK